MVTLNNSSSCNKEKGERRATGKRSSQNAKSRGVRIIQVK
jgi:hypothetical protein